MNKLNRWLWWLDRDDQRFQSSWWAKLGFAIVWLFGFLVLLLFGELAMRMFAGTK